MYLFLGNSKTINKRLPWHLSPVNHFGHWQWYFEMMWGSLLHVPPLRQGLLSHGKIWTAGNNNKQTLFHNYTWFGGVGPVHKVKQCWRLGATSFHNALFHHKEKHRIAVRHHIAIEIPHSLVGPQSATPLFLFTYDKLAIIFYSEHVETKEITFKLLTMIKHTFRNITYRKIIQSRFTKQSE